MTFEIDTGGNGQDVFRKSSGIDDTMRVDMSDFVRAERMHRQIIENIEVHEDPADLDKYVADESVIIDALFLAWPDFAAAIQDVHETHRACLIHGAQIFAAPTPQAGAPEYAITQNQGNRKMFVIDTGNTGGSKGPWISWTSEGSARKGLAPESWVLREKVGEDANAHWRQVAVEAFKSGCVMDLDSLKLGWEKDGGQGVAPERRWNPSLSQATARPDDSKKPGGGYTWGKALTVRCAIGGGKAATWEQAAYGAYEAFDMLSKQIVAQWPTHSQNGALLPLVKQTSIRREQMKRGSTSIPVLEIVKWVARPDCLKDDAPAIATGPAPTPEPVQTATPKPAPQPAPVMAEGDEF